MKQMSVKVMLSAYNTTWKLTWLENLKAESL